MGELITGNVEISMFDYSSIDKETAAFLQVKVERITEISGKALTDIGMELKEAQEKLAKKGYGCFEAWYTSLGYKKDHVYGLINRYNLIVGNPDKRNLIESLPKSLVEEIAKPSAKKEAVQEVFNGDITTLKQYQEVLTKLNSAESDVKKLQDELKKEKEKSKKQINGLQVSIDETKKKLSEAQTSGDNAEVERLQITLGETECELADANKKIEELERQLKTQPIEAAVVEKIPENIERELEELRSLKSKQETENKAGQGNPAIVKYSIYFQELSKNFKELLGALAEIKDSDEELYLKYKNATSGLISKMNDHL